MVERTENEEAQKSAGFERAMPILNNSTRDSTRSVLYDVTKPTPLLDDLRQDSIRSWQRQTSRQGRRTIGDDAPSSGSCSTSLPCVVYSIPVSSNQPTNQASNRNTTMSISYEEALATLQSMFGETWSREDLDTVLRHKQGQ